MIVQSSIVDNLNRYEASCNYIKQCIERSKNKTRRCPYDSWPINPIGNLDVLWVRELEDAILMANVKQTNLLNASTSRNSNEYIMHLTDIGETIAMNYHPNMPPGLFPLLKDVEYIDDPKYKQKNMENTDDEEDEEDEDNDDDALIKCSKCSGKARWKLKQTRSADEPMTQFCECTKCGHKWKQ